MLLQREILRRKLSCNQRCFDAISIETDGTNITEPHEVVAQSDAEKIVGNTSVGLQDLDIIDEPASAYRILNAQLRKTYLNSIGALT